MFMLPRMNQPLCVDLDSAECGKKKKLFPDMARQRKKQNLFLSFQGLLNMAVRVCADFDCMCVFDSNVRQDKGFGLSCQEWIIVCAGADPPLHKRSTA